MVFFHISSFKFIEKYYCIIFISYQLNAIQWYIFKQIMIQPLQLQNNISLTRCNKTNHDIYYFEKKGKCKAKYRKIYFQNLKNEYVELKMISTGNNLNKKCWFLTLPVYWCWSLPICKQETYYPTTHWWLWCLSKPVGSRHTKHSFLNTHKKRQMTRKQP